MSRQGKQFLFVLLVIVALAVIGNRSQSDIPSAQTETIKAICETVPLARLPAYCQPERTIGTVIENTIDVIAYGFLVVVASGALIIYRTRKQAVKA